MFCLVSIQKLFYYLELRLSIFRCCQKENEKKLWQFILIKIEIIKIEEKKIKMNSTSWTAIKKIVWVDCDFMWSVESRQTKDFLRSAPKVFLCPWVSILSHSNRLHSVTCLESVYGSLRLVQLINVSIKGY